MSALHGRRRTLKLLGIAAAWPLAVTPAIAADRIPTPKLTLGPFYPTIFPTDADADMTRVAGRDAPAMGVILDVSGRLMDRKGTPIANAQIEFWQADNDGRYLHVGPAQPRGDPNFQGYAALATDAEGRYKVRTIKPVPYSGRTPHIHFLVKEGGRQVLVSQMFIEGHPGNDGDGIYRSLGANASVVTMKLEDAPRDSGAKLRGSLDIVLAR